MDGEESFLKKITFKLRAKGMNEDDRDEYYSQKEKYVGPQDKIRAFQRTKKDSL